MSAAPKKGFWRAVQGEIRGVQSFLLLISLQPPPRASRSPQQLHGASRSRRLLQEPAGPPLVRGCPDVKGTQRGERNKAVAGWSLARSQSSPSSAGLEGIWGLGRVLQGWHRCSVQKKPQN